MRYTTESLKGYIWGSNSLIPCEPTVSWGGGGGEGGAGRYRLPKRLHLPSVRKGCLFQSKYPKP